MSRVSQTQSSPSHTLQKVGISFKFLPPAGGILPRVEVHLAVRENLLRVSVFAFRRCLDSNLVFDGLRKYQWISRLGWASINWWHLAGGEHISKIDRLIEYIKILSGMLYFLLQLCFIKRHREGRKESKGGLESERAENFVSKTSSTRTSLQRLFLSYTLTSICYVVVSVHGCDNSS